MNEQTEQTHRRRRISVGDVTYVLGSLFMSIMRAFPAPQRIRAINKASPFLGRLLHAANIPPTRTIRENLHTMFDSNRSPDEIETHIRRLLSMLVWNSLMINNLPAFTREQIIDLVPMDGISCLDDYLAGGHPVLIWGYHFGISPLIIAGLLHMRGYPIHAIAHVRQTPATASMLQFFYFLQMQSISDQLSVIDPGKSVQRDALDVFKNKECLYVTPDYMIPERERRPRSAFEVPIDFLGRKAYLQTGGLRLAKRFGVKVVTVLSTQADGENRRLLVEPFELPTSGFKPPELQQDLQMCVERLQAQVIAHPYWWLDLRRNDLTRRLKKSPTEPGE